MAGKVGVARNTLKSWAYNDRLPRADEALAIADALGENAFYLVSGNEDVKRGNNKQKKDIIVELLDHADKETIDVVYDLLMARVKK